jgi:SAM-dependent methyltransferase
MAATATRPETRQSEWFASWFDSPHYHRLYGRRDDAEAARFVDALTLRLEIEPGARVLDLGCGAGRHSRRLASKGLRVTGLDLAANSIREAREHEHALLRFRRHDMRMPFGRQRFDYVFNFFTSFGYFSDRREHLAVVRNMATALRPGGRLVLDYLNSRYAEARLVPEETAEVDGPAYQLTRWTDGRHFFKRIVIANGAGRPFEYVERVARFTLHDFERMFAAHHLNLEAAYGDYTLGAYETARSPRMILVARKPDHARDRCLRTRLSVSGVTPRYDASMNCGTRCTRDGYFLTNAS